MLSNLLNPKFVMLLPNALASQIVSNLNHSEACMTYLQSIKDYIESNIMILATYTGVTPLGAPDPNSGPVKLKLTITPTFTQGNMVKAFIASLKEADPNAFIKAVMSECTADLISGPLPYTMSSIAIYSISSLSSGDLRSLASENNTYVDNWNIICKPLVDSFKSLKNITPLATTTPAGTGMTVINSVS